MMKQDIVTESDQFRCLFIYLWFFFQSGIRSLLFKRISSLFLCNYGSFIVFAMLFFLSIEEFIPLLRERMNVLNPYVRQFLVGWITVLDSVPDIDMLGFLPDFLDGNYMLFWHCCDCYVTLSASSWFPDKIQVCSIC